MAQCVFNKVRDELHQQVRIAPDKNRDRRSVQLYTLANLFGGRLKRFIDIGDQLAQVGLLKSFPPIPCFYLGNAQQCVKGADDIFGLFKCCYCALRVDGPFIRHLFKTLPQPLQWGAKIMSDIIGNLNLALYQILKLFQGFVYTDGNTGKIVVRPPSCGHPCGKHTSGYLL